MGCSTATSCNRDWAGRVDKSGGESGGNDGDLTYLHHLLHVVHGGVQVDRGVLVRAVEIVASEVAAIVSDNDAVCGDGKRGEVLPGMVRLAW